MPNGDLLTAPYQAQLGGSIDFLFGTGENGISFDLTQGSALTGLLDIVTKSNDVDLPGTDGKFFNPDYRDVTQIHIPLVMRGADPQNSLNQLISAWAPQVADLDFVVALPDATHAFLPYAYVGRPRGLTTDVSLKPRAVIRALVRFDVTSGSWTVD